MKALSIKQPGPDLILSGRQTIHVTQRGTTYRGPLLICASAEPPAMHAGCMICVVDLTYVDHMEPEDAKPGNHFFHKRLYSWHLVHPRETEHKPAKGVLGLFEVEDERIEYLTGA